MQRGRESRRVGLARALSKLGYCSRSQAAALIRSGRVQLNGATRREPEAPVHLERDRIAVDGRAVGAAAKIYVMLNKPRGVVTTASDEKGRATVYSVLNKVLPGAPPGTLSGPRSEALPWVGPVGRLDQASEGLLLLTNDSEWAARITDPMTHLNKTYHVQVAAKGMDRLAEALMAGVRCDGELLRAKRAGVLRRGEKNAWLEIVLDEGKNRQIRRMLEQLGIEVLRLVRVAIGPLALGALAKGQARALTAAEKAWVDQALKQPRSKQRVAKS